MAQQTPAAARSSFSTSFGILAATLGSAVGLGNIWKVPYLTGAHGGAGFLLVYLLATLLVGLPVMMAELALGRCGKANPISVLRSLAPARQPWWLVGLSGMLAAFLIMSFYSEVVAWVFAYIIKAVRGTIMSGASADHAGHAARAGAGRDGAIASRHAGAIGASTRNRSPLYRAAPTPPLRRSHHDGAAQAAARPGIRF